MKQEAPDNKKEDEKILKQWKMTKQLSNKTFNNYRNTIQHYTQATGMTITQLYNEALQEEEDHIPRYRKQIKYHLLEFKEYLDNTSLKENSKNCYYKTIKSFYQSLDIELPRIESRYDDNPTSSTYEKLITKDLIRLMVDNATQRDKAILSFAAMTGQAITEISNLDIQDIVDAWNNVLEEKIFSIDDVFKQKTSILSHDVCTLHITRQKTRNKYWVYIPKETSRHIIDYLYERQAGANERIRITSFDTPLFVTKDGQRMPSGTVGNVFLYVGERCGFEKPELWEDNTRLLLERGKGEQRVYTCHKYRKYFLNMCRRYAGTNSETPSEHVYTGSELGDFWIGHQARGSISHYLQYNDEDVRELCVHYLQVLPYLSLEVEVDTLTTRDKQEFLEMKQKYEEVQRELDEFREYVKQKQKLDMLAKKYGIEDI